MIKIYKHPKSCRKVLIFIGGDLKNQTVLEIENCRYSFVMSSKMDYRSCCYII